MFTEVPVRLLSMGRDWILPINSWICILTAELICRTLPDWPPDGWKIMN
jgi:hypothetical protein